jgi:hypothetical protein
MRFAADYSQTLEVFFSPTDGISGHLYISHSLQYKRKQQVRQKYDSVKIFWSNSNKPIAFMKKLRAD